MAEELPDGTRQGYFNVCKDCGKEIEVNMQGTPMNHKCDLNKIEQKRNGLIQHVKETQRKLQTERGYGEMNGQNDLVNYFNEFWQKEYDKSLTQIKDDFYNLCLVFNSISSHSTQGHWKSVMSTMCGWFLSKHDAD